MIVTDMPLESLISHARLLQQYSGHYRSEGVDRQAWLPPAYRGEREDDGDVGHTRLESTKPLGLAAVPVHVAVGLTTAQAKAYRIMDNRSHENVEWDDERLQLQLDDLWILGAHHHRGGLWPCRAHTDHRVATVRLACIVH